MLYQFISLFLVSRGLQELIPLNYDKHIMTNIIIRSYHSLGCIYYLTPILLKIEHSLIEIETSRVPPDIEFVLTRSAYFFMWDIYSLSLSNENEKMLYTLHHLISCGTIVYSLYYEINWYFVTLGLFLAEVTNPITQISETCNLLNYYNNRFETFYFILMLIIRGFISPCLIIIFMCDLSYKYSIYGSVILTQSILINYVTMTSITFVSIDWLNNKYEQIILADIKKIKN
jgi:hypothetical protein